MLSGYPLFFVLVLTEEVEGKDSGIAPLHFLSRVALDILHAELNLDVGVVGKFFVGIYGGP